MDVIDQAVQALRSAGMEAEGRHVVPVPGAHRNLTWRVTYDTSAIAYVKVASPGNEPLVAREAEVLRVLNAVAGLPRLLSSGSADGAFVITTALEGQTLSHWLGGSPNDEACRIAFRQIAQWLMSFARSAPQNFAASFSEGSDPRDCWAANYQPDGTRASPNVELVHGSFEPDNIIVGLDRPGQSIGAVDLEACRLGPGWLDVASLALHLMLLSRTDLSIIWLQCAGEVWSRPDIATAVWPFVVAQNNRRISAHAVSPGVEFIRDLAPYPPSDWEGLSDGPDSP